MKTKLDYLTELQLKLASILPKEEAEDAYLYFEEYILEADLTMYDEIKSKLGTPREVSYNAIIDYQEVQMRSGEGKGKIKWLLPVMLLLSAPVGLPLIMAAVLVMLSALLVLGTIILVVYLFVGLFWGVGVIFLLTSLFALFEHIPTAIFYLGVGLTLIAIAWITTPKWLKLSKELAISSYTYLLNKIRPKKTGDATYFE